MGAPPISAAVADRLLSEGLVPLREIAAALPPTRQGRPVSSTCVWRWIVEGVRGVHLEAVRLNGGHYFTSRPALARFAAARTLRRW